MNAQRASISIIVLIVLGMLTISILGYWKMISAQAQIMNLSIVAEQEDRLCTSMAEIGILLVKNHVPAEKGTLADFTYRIPGPSWYSAYSGEVSLSIGRPLIPLEVALHYKGQRRRGLKIMLTYDVQHAQIQVLEWLPL